MLQLLTTHLNRRMEKSKIIITIYFDILIRSDSIESILIFRINNYKFSLFDIVKHEKKVKRKKSMFR